MVPPHMVAAITNRGHQTTKPCNPYNRYHLGRPRTRWFEPTGMTHMHRWANCLKNLIARSDDPAASDGQEQLRTLRYLVADEACSAAEHALRCRNLSSAEEALARDMSIDPTHPRLLELYAWYYLDTNQADKACTTLESMSDMTARARLLLQLVRLQTGGKAMAHLELNQWSRQRDCPAAARVLLAALDIEAGHVAEARAVLSSQPALASDPQACRLLILMDLAQDLPLAARRAAHILLRRFARHEHASRFLVGLGLADQLDESALPIEMIDQLAGELLEKPEVIRSLAVAQQCRPERLHIELLRRAIGRIVDQLPQPIEALESLAMLAELAGDMDEARRWAQRGLSIAPMNATLALIQEHATVATEEATQATDDLRRVADAFPQYPDVQRAMVLHYHRLGMKASAQRVLRRWLTQSDDPLAIRTREELAA